MNEIEDNEEGKEKLSGAAAGPSPQAPTFAAPRPDTVKGDLLSDDMAAPASHALSGEPSVPRRRAVFIFGALALLFLIVLAGAFVWRQFARKPADLPPPVSEAAPVETTEPETPLLGGARDEAATIGAAAPDKIFNRAADGVKAGAAAIARDNPPPEGAISELPAPPSGATDGNDDLQRSAKDAAKLFRSKAAGEEIDLSDPDAGAALESLEQAPAAPPENSPTIPPMPAPATPDENSPQAMGADASSFAQALDAERARNLQQAAEIASLRAELAVVQSASAPLAQRVAAATSFLSMKEKAISGAPYAAELQAFLATGAAPVAGVVADYAVTGLPTIADLNDEFPAMRDAALGAARRERATGPAAKLVANFASFVRLRASGPIKGAAPAAIVSRAEAALGAGDLSAALGELSGLTGSARDAAAPWIARATQREDAARALDEIGAAISAGLAEGAQQG